MIRKILFGAMLAGLLASCTPGDLSDIEAKARDGLRVACANQPGIYAAFVAYADATNLKQSARDKASNANDVVTAVCRNQNSSFVVALADVLAQVAIITQARKG